MLRGICTSLGKEAYYWGEKKGNLTVGRDLVWAPNILGKRDKNAASSDTNFDRIILTLLEDDLNIYNITY